jgi:mRNA interferase HigB
MDVVGRDVLEELKRTHADVRSRADTWLQETIDAKWTSPKDVKQRYPSASILGENRVVFDLGNRYRLLVRIAYRTGKVVLLRAGTHAEYDRWDLRREG